MLINFRKGKRGERDRDREKEIETDISARGNIDRLYMHRAGIELATF